MWFKVWYRTQWSHKIVSTRVHGEGMFSRYTCTLVYNSYRTSRQTEHITRSGWTDAAHEYESSGDGVGWGWAEVVIFPRASRQVDISPGVTQDTEFFFPSPRTLELSLQFLPSCRVHFIKYNNSDNNNNNIMLTEAIYLCGWNEVQRFSPSHLLLITALIVAPKLAIHCHSFVYLIVCSPPLAQTVPGNRWGPTLNLTLLQKWSISNSICNETPGDPSAGGCCLFFLSFPLGTPFQRLHSEDKAKTPPQSASNYGCQSCIPAIGHRRCKQKRAARVRASAQYFLSDGWLWKRWAGVIC